MVTLNENTLIPVGAVVSILYVALRGQKILLSLKNKVDNIETLLLSRPCVRKDITACDFMHNTETNNKNEESPIL